MPTFFRARVKETTTSTGTGALQLLGAVSGYQSFLSPFGADARCYYFIVEGSAWEYGLGTIRASSQLERTLLIASTTGSLLNLSAGIKNVYCAIVPTALVNNGIETFTNGDTTPSIRSANVWFANNSSSTTITQFDDAIDGQIVTVVFGNSNTTIQHGTGFRLAGGANFAGTSNDTIRLLMGTGVGYEISRSVNT